MNKKYDKTREPGLCRTIKAPTLSQKLDSLKESMGKPKKSKLPDWLANVG